VYKKTKEVQVHHIYKYVKKNENTLPAANPTVKEKTMRSATSVCSTGASTVFGARINKFVPNHPLLVANVTIMKKNNSSPNKTGNNRWIGSPEKEGITTLHARRIGMKLSLKSDHKDSHPSDSM
jgi:hypothetical protein